MNAIKQIVNANALDEIIKLPKSFRGHEVEVIVLLNPAESAGKTKKTPVRPTRSELDKMMKGSVTESLLGSIPHAYMTSAEIREERLAQKYGYSD